MGSPPSSIETLRHSTAHLMAQAIGRLYAKERPQFGIGPVIEHGLYYDVDMDCRIHEEDLPKIEEEMRRIIGEDLPIERRPMGRQEALDFFKREGQNLKVELIEGFPEDEEISCYTQGEFVDLCRGPHVERTGQIPLHFKLLNVAGAYWKGDEKRPMLQRVYAACFAGRKELKSHLLFLEEVKKRDHRVLGKELELFCFDQTAPGMPFFYPKGAFVYNELIQFMRRIYHRSGFREVVTPQLFDSVLWHTSGHYQHYKENMYFTEVDQREFALKPMNCPAHMLLFKKGKHSYRDLPMRLADFGRLHRHERSGTLSGVTRVRSMCQDDAHIFLAPSQMLQEIQSLLESYFICYRHFGFQKFKVLLSTRPEERTGSDRQWDQAEVALEEALKANGVDFQVSKGDGAFYGPKIDFDVTDAIGRYHQMGTIQLDFQLPERFDITFVSEKGDLQRPVVIHKALLGSIERFFAVYLEHVGGAYPFWLAPEQAVIVPVDENVHLPYARELYEDLLKQDRRVRIDARRETLALKTRQIQKAKVPFMLVVGNKEREEGSVSVRAYGEKRSQTWTRKELIERFEQLSQESTPWPWKKS